MEKHEREQFGPYGYHGNHIGHFALHMLAELSEPKSAELDDIAIWDESDKRAYDHFVEMDTGVRLLEPSDDVAGEDLGDLYRIFERLRLALPLSESERRWLQSEPRLSAEDLPQAIAGETAEVMEAGQLRVIQGRELSRRWWAWRRECQEFAWSGALTETREALIVLANRLVTSRHWPHEYSRWRIVEE
jgi:hypothetical protein